VIEIPRRAASEDYAAPVVDKVTFALDGHFLPFVVVDSESLARGSDSRGDVAPLLQPRG